MKLIIAISLFFILFCNTVVADDWTVTWEPIKESIIDKEYSIAVQNLQSVKRDVDISSFFAETNFDISKLIDIKFYEWKLIPYNYTVNHYDEIEHSGYSEINDTWDNWTESVFNYTEIVESEKLDWKACKSQLFKEDSISKENNYGFINIPAYGSKLKDDGTYNGTKLFKLTFKTPIIHIDNYGSGGKVAILLDGIEHHPYWNTTWSTQEEIILTGGASGALTNYSMLLNVSYETGMQADFDDLRFCNDTDEIDSWLESKVDSSYALIRVEFPTTPANAAKQTYYMYYGNAVTASNWDIGAAFLFGDDFSGSSYDTAKWNVKVGTEATYIVSGGVLTFFDTNAASTDYIQTAYSTDIPVVYEYRRTYDPTEIYICPIAFGSPATDGFGEHVATNDQNRAFATDNNIISTGSGWVIDSSPHNYKVVCTGSRIEIFEDNISKSSVTANIPTDVLNLRLGQVVGSGSAGNDMQGVFDWVFVRKYASGPPTYAFGNESYYAGSIHYNNTNPYNNTIDSNGAIAVNRTIITSDNIGWTASALTDDCHLIVTQYNLNNVTIANFTLYTASLDWLIVTGLSSYTYYNLSFSNGTFIESQKTNGNGNGIAYFTTNLIVGSYIIEKGETEHPFLKGALQFFGEMKSGLTDFRDSIGKYLIWGIIFFGVGLAFTIFAKIKQTLIGGK